MVKGVGKKRKGQHCDDVGQFLESCWGLIMKIPKKIYDSKEHLTERLYKLFTVSCAVVPLWGSTKGATGSQHQYINIDIGI